MNDLDGRENRVIILGDGDDVAVAVSALRPGAEIAAGNARVTTKDAIPAAHKVSLHMIPARGAVRKYGQIIGWAREAIEPGRHVHTHNLSFEMFARKCEVGTNVREIGHYGPDQARTFEGYLREDGRAGTRNYVAVLSTVNCSASVSRHVADAFGTDVMKAYPHVDGVMAITHKTGCGLAEGLRDHRQLERVLAGYARHPNVFGYVVIGLGCEINQPIRLMQNTGLVKLGDSSPGPMVISIQEVGGVQKAVDAGRRAVAELLGRANQARRSRLPLSRLMLATNCGGSDGNSGITANPALGLAADELIRHGGTAILGETPEMYGAEHLLTARARRQEAADKLLDILRWWEQYTTFYGATMDNNPAPGNREGGLTTIFEKSLGAIAKGGSMPLEAVYEYAQQVTERGFVIMDTPGYDPVSMTGLVAGGANIAVFTTGRGSCYGGKPTPSIKVASNTPLYRHMIDDMDVNAGGILEGQPMEDVGREIFEEMVAVASGKKTKSERCGIGEEEFAPWTIGPVM